MGFIRLSEEEKQYRISLLSDNIKTDSEIANILSTSIQYVRNLRKRWNLPQKRRGNKKGTIVNKFTINCKLCEKEFSTTPSDTDRQYCSRECMWKCIDYRTKLSNADKSYMQTDNYRETKTNSNTTEYKKYANKVHKLTQKSYELYEHEINPHKHIRALAGITGSYHLDHKISIRYGYENGISPKVLADKTNLQMLPWRDNIVKGKNCNVSSEQNPLA